MIKVTKKTDMLMILLSAIVVEENFNPRKENNFGDIDGLAKSIAEIGQDQPLKVCKVRGEEKYILTAGHRRLRAIKLANSKYNAGIERVNCIISSGDEKRRLFTALLDGDGVQKLTNSEMVQGVKRLLEMGISSKEIVASLGINKSQAQAYNLVAAAKAPEAIQQLLDDGVISVAVVNRLQRETSSDDELVEKAQEEVAKGKGKSTKKKVSPIIATLEEAIKLSDETSPKVATLKAIVNKLKRKASAEDIAKLLK